MADMRRVYCNQRGSNQTNLGTEKSLTEHVDSWDRQHAEKRGKGLQPGFRVSQQHPASQQKVVEGHVGFAPPHGSQKQGKRLARDDYAETLRRPEAPHTKHVKAQ